MGTHYDDPNSRSWPLPAPFQGDDVRLSEDVIERYITCFTEAGDLIFDPFAGFGTTLIVAERLGRIGMGCEILKDRAQDANSLLTQGHVRVGDIRAIDLSDVCANLILSSPPYMNRGDREDPLTGYRKPVRAYERYVTELASIYIRMGALLAADGKLVIQLQNLRNQQGATPLAFDLYCAIGQGLVFVGEEVTTWNEECYGYTHGYCLIYTCA